MKDLILAKIKEIEVEKGIHIILCVESGSRVWRMHSKDSDYDVRFVYVHPVSDYISISPPKEVISRHYDKSGNKQQAEGCYLDFCGFDIFKFMKMLSSSNPTTIEWLLSDIVYLDSHERQSTRLRDWAKSSFKHISLYHHYKSMCRQNYLKYLNTRKLVTYKKYLYAMRGLVNAKWVLYNNSLPPIDFNETLQLSKQFLPKWLIDKLFRIIELKREGREKDVIQNEVKIDEYIESFLKDTESQPANTHATTTMLEEVLKDIVLGESLLDEVEGIGDDK